MDRDVEVVEMVRGGPSTGGGAVIAVAGKGVVAPWNGWDSDKGGQ